MTNHLAAALIAALVLLATPAGASTLEDRNEHINEFLTDELTPTKGIDSWAHTKQIRVKDGWAHEPTILKEAWVSFVASEGYVKPPKPEPVVASSSTAVTVTAPSSGVGAQVGIRGIICDVFGPYCSQALAVVACESGFSTAAVNGQYLGLFQMGANERATYGHGSDAYSQARAAYAYFVASGSDWSPWACKP